MNGKGNLGSSTSQINWNGLCRFLGYLVVLNATHQKHLVAVAGSIVWLPDIHVGLHIARTCGISHRFHAVSITFLQIIIYFPVILSNHFLLAPLQAASESLIYLALIIFTKHLDVEIIELILVEACFRSGSCSRNLVVKDERLHAQLLSSLIDELRVFCATHKG